MTVDTRIIFWQRPSYVRLIPETFGCKIVAPTQDLWQRSFLYLLVARTKLIVQKHCAGEEITEGWTVYVHVFLFWIRIVTIKYISRFNTPHSNNFLYRQGWELFLRLSGNIHIHRGFRSGNRIVNLSEKNYQINQLLI